MVCNVKGDGIAFYSVKEVHFKIARVVFTHINDIVAIFLLLDSDWFYFFVFHLWFHHLGTEGSRDFTGRRIGIGAGSAYRSFGA